MEKLKSIYEWYFKDSIKISSPSLDEGSKRLGKVIAILGGWFVGGGGAVMILEGLNIGQSFLAWCFVCVVAIFIGPKATYLIFRGSLWVIFWVVDGFRNPKE